MDIHRAIEIAASKPPARWLEKAWEQKPSLHRVGNGVSVRGWNLERTDLPGMVLLHGYRAHARWWDHIAPLLAEDYRVVAFDLAGMGDSESRDTYSRRDYAEDLLCVAEVFGFSKPVVIAHSFGGIVTWFACSLYPDKFSRAILVDSIIEPHMWEKRKMLQTGFRRFYSDLDTGMQHFRLIPPGETPDPHVMTYIAEHSLVETAEGWTWKYDPDIAENMNGEPLGDMPELEVPVDYIYGEHSKVVPQKRVANILRNLPTCERALVIPASDHHILIDQPLALVAAVRGLLMHPHARLRA